MIFAAFLRQCRLDDGEVSAHDVLGSVYYFLQPLSFLGVQVSEPGCDVTC